MVKNREKGMNLFDDGKVRQIGEYLYRVQSQDGDEEYWVENLQCSCRAARFSPDTFCKHAWAVLIFIGRNPEDLGITNGPVGTPMTFPAPRDQPSAATASIGPGLPENSPR